MNWKSKLSSRKFWAAVAGLVVSIMVVFGADADKQERITGIITATGTLAVYILAEGSTDKAALSSEDDKKD